MAVQTKLSPDQKARVSRSKSFRIDISFEQKSNEPNLTLGHLLSLLTSLEDTFKTGQNKVEFPSTNSFTLLDGAQETIAAQGASFTLVLDRFRLQDAQNQLGGIIGPLAYVNSRLYPDDVVAILDTARRFLTRYYQTQEQSFSWSYQLPNISEQLKDAFKNLDNSSLTRLSLGTLKNSVSETTQKVRVIHDGLQEEEAVKVDPIKPLVNETQLDPIKTWKNPIERIAVALRNANLGDHVIITDNHSYAVNEIRELLNYLFDTIREQLTSSKRKNRLEKIGNQLKIEFIEQRDRYCFSGSELLTETIQSVDSLKTERYIELFEKVIKDLAKKETAKSAADEEEEDEDQEGGDEDKQPQEPSVLTQQKIRQQLFRYLREDSWDDFLSYYNHLSINPQDFPDEKKAFLRDLYQDLAADLLDQYNVQQQLSKQIKSWLKQTYQVDVNQDEQTYSFGTTQRQQLQASITQFFFSSYSERFVEIIKETASLPKQVVDPTEEKELERLEGHDHLTEVVLPPKPNLEQVAETADPSIAAEQSRFIAEATTAFIGLYFPQINLSQQEETQLRRLIASALTRQLAEIPNEKLAKGSARGIILSRIFPKIFLDSEFNQNFFGLGQDVYNRQLEAAGLLTEAEKLNIYNTVDSLVVILDDPETIIERMTNRELLLNFNLPDNFSNYAQLRQLLKGLIRLRQARQTYQLRLKITPLLIGEEGRDRFYQNQEAYLVPTRVLIKETGSDAVAFLQDSDSIEQAAISDSEKKELFQWREQLWHSTIIHLENEEIIEVYNHYGVTIEEINWKVLAVPEHFSYIELAQLAGADQDALSPEQTQLAGFAQNIFNQAKPSQGLNNKLTKMLGKKGTKAILAAIAPEALPVLNTLEKLPIIGEQIEKKYEQIGQIAKLASMAGAGLLAFFIWLFRSANAVIGAAIGGTLGGILASIIPGIGTAIGAVLGSILGGIIGNWVGQAGGLSSALGVGGGASSSTVSASSTAAGSGAAASTPAAQAAAAAGRGGGAIAGAANSAGGILAATGATVAVGYGVVNHLNSGTQIRPMSDIMRQEDLPGGTYDPGTGQESIYVNIEKTPTPEEVAEAPATITYHISIQPKGYDLVITNVKDEVEAFTEGEFTGVTPVLDIADFPNLKEGQVINAASGLEFEYEQTYDSNYQDSMVANTFTLSFDYCPTEDVEGATPSATPTAIPNNSDEPYDCPSGGGSAEAATIASVVIGDAPTAKEGCWPAAGTLTQMPFGDYSHCAKERPWAENKPCLPATGDDAVDIGNNLGTPVCSPFNGIVSKVDSGASSSYGLQVEVTAGGAVYKFAHLSAISVSPGQNVSPGTLLGKMGATGGDWGVHLHYSRINTDTGRFYSYPLNATSILLSFHQGEPNANSCCIFGELGQ